MSSSPTPLSAAFGPAHAEIYDTQFERIRAVKDALHLLIDVALQPLPADARVLVAGAGTGAEARFLAALHPGWRFTLADPSEAMLAVARRHAEAEGFVDRCTFHVGYVADLAPDPHDAATSLLVSHFLTDAGTRAAYFGDIAARLRSGGVLFNADISTDRAAPTLGPLLALWLDMLTYAGRMSPDNRGQYRAAFGRDFGVHSPAEVEAFLSDAGFEPVVPCYQAGLIRGWLATRR